MSNVEIKYGLSYVTLEDEFIREILRLKKDGPMAPLAVVTHSNSLLSHLKERLCREMPDGIMNTHFLNFHSLALKTTGNAVDEFKIISDTIQPEYMVRDIIKKHFGHSRFFGGIADHSGVAGALLSAINDLDDANIPFEVLDDAMRNGFFTGEDLQKIKEVFEIYRIFTERLEEMGLLTQAGLARKASELAKESEFLKKTGRIFYYGFYDLTGAQFDFLDAVCAVSQVTIYFPFEKKHPAFAFAEPVFNHYNISRHSPARTRIEYDPKSTAAGRIAERLFNAGRGPVTTYKGKTIHIINTSGAKDELWCTAKEILGLVRKGIPFGEIAVTARTLEPYAPHIREIMEENCIPFYTDARLPLARHPLIKTILVLLELAQRKFDRRDMMEIILSPYFTAGLAGKISDPYELDRLTCALGIARNETEWLKKLEQPLKNHDDFLKSSEKNGILHKLGDIRKNRTAMLELFRGISEDLRDFYAVSGLDALAGKTAEITLKYLSAVENDKYACTAMRSFTAILDSIRALPAFGDPACNADEFLRLLTETINHTGLPVTPERTGGVKLMDIMSARGITAEFIFILGLNEKVFPRIVRQEPFLSDSFRKEFRDRARHSIKELGYKIDEKMRGYEEEKLLFHLACSSARQGLYLVYQRTDESGKTAIASPFMREIYTASGGTVSAKDVRKIPRRFSEKIEGPANRHDLSPKEFAASLRLKGRMPETDSTLYSASAECLVKTETISPRLTEYDCPASDFSEWFTAKTSAGISPSAIEDFADCPYLFYCANILGLRKKSEPASIETPEKIDRGTMVHDILKDYFQNGGKGPAAACANRIFDEYERGNAVGYPLVWHEFKTDIIEKLDEFLSWDADRRKESGFKPAFFEQKGIAEILMGDITVRFKGKIDRIDIKEENGDCRFRVIDYKTKSTVMKGLNLEDVQFGAIQLPVYMLIAENILRERYKKTHDVKFIPAGGEYCYVFDEKRVYNPKSINGNFWETHRKEFEEKLAILAGYVKKGLLFINPDSAHCDYCDYRRICRRENFPNKFRAKKDRLTENYRTRIYDPKLGR